MSRLYIVFMSFLISACAAGGASTALPRAGGAAPSTISTAGLEAVLGKNVRQLIRLFGEPRLNVKEPPARKLQFVGKACILDAYLYPDGNQGANGKQGTERVTHVDARRGDGAEVDRASCIRALSQR